ncbi:O-antigen ligase family protein [Hippea maritima]|uniref:O-antigen polymerase n=1 Tax=Hippea maritima (strain ATCC 700847 / DSM 10411 / MH2) TaxID=760142 RepID=F2LUS7_HIPMA|nr:O-antigen ligase family protein [Hippea maritima]AEA33532.1 O-antigen polymerase [Hippea maritima DSM 10411]
MNFLILSAILLSISTPLSIALDNVAIGVGLLGLILSYKKLKPKDLDFRVLGVSTVGFVSSVLSTEPVYSLKNAHYLWHFLPYFIASRFDRKKIKLILVVLGAASAISGFAVIFQSFTGIRINHVHLNEFLNIHILHSPIRSSGVFGNALTTGGVLAPLMFVYFSLFWFEAERRFKIYYLIVFIFVFLGLVFNFSRSYWVGGLAAIVVLPFIYTKSRIARITPLAGFVLAALMYIFIPSVHKRVQSMVHYRKDVSAMDRIVLWQAGIDLYKDYNIKNKLIGCGSGNLYRHLKPYLIKRVKAVFGDKGISAHLFSAVHNEYLQILLKWGVIGLIVWLYLWGYVLYRNVIFIRKTDNEFYRGIVIGLTMGFIAFLVGGFFEHNVGDAEVIISVMFLLGLNKNVLDSMEGER